MLMPIASVVSAVGLYVALLRLRPKKCDKDEGKAKANAIIFDSVKDVQNVEDPAAGQHACALELEKKLAQALHQVKLMEEANAQWKEEKAVLINKLGAASKAATSAEAAEQACKYAAQHKQEQLEVQLRSLRLQLQFYGAEWASQQDKVKKSESENLSASHEVKLAQQRLQEIEERLPGVLKTAEDLKIRLKGEIEKRKAAQKRTAEANIRIDAMAKAKARSDQDHRICVEALKKDLLHSNARRQEAESECKKLREQAAVIQAKVRNVASAWQKDRDKLAAAELELSLLRNQLAGEQQRRRDCEQRRSAAARTMKSHEAELRILKGAMHNDFGGAMQNPKQK